MFGSRSEAHSRCASCSTFEPRVGKPSWVRPDSKRVSSTCDNTQRESPSNRAPSACMIERRVKFGVNSKIRTFRRLASALSVPMFTNRIAVSSPEGVRRVSFTQVPERNSPTVPLPNAPRRKRCARRSVGGDTTSPISAVNNAQPSPASTIALSARTRPMPAARIAVNSDCDAKRANAYTDPISEATGISS